MADESNKDRKKIIPAKSRYVVPEAEEVMPVAEAVDFDIKSYLERSYDTTKKSNLPYLKSSPRFWNVFEEVIQRGDEYELGLLKKIIRRIQLRGFLFDDTKEGIHPLIFMENAPPELVRVVFNFMVDNNLYLNSRSPKMQSKEITQELEDIRRREQARVARVKEEVRQQVAKFKADRAEFGAQPPIYTSPSRRSSRDTDEPPEPPDEPPEPPEGNGIVLKQKLKGFEISSDGYGVEVDKLFMQITKKTLVDIMKQLGEEENQHALMKKSKVVLMHYFMKKYASSQRTENKVVADNRPKKKEKFETVQDKRFAMYEKEQRQKRLEKMKQDNRMQEALISAPVKLSRPAPVKRKDVSL